MTAALNPTGIWDSSVCKAEEHLCGHVHGSRGKESNVYASGSYIQSKEKHRPKSYRRAANAELHERGGAISAQQYYAVQGRNHIEMSGGVEKPATTAAQTCPPLGAFQILRMEMVNN